MWAGGELPRMGKRSHPGVSAPTAALEQPYGGGPASPCRAASVKLRRNEECFLNQTANYQLSQWETTDRILMTDFNADNAKIDAALQGLSEKAALVTLADVSLMEDAEVLCIPLADVDWTQWKRIYLLASGKGTNGQVRHFGFYLNESRNAMGVTGSTTEQLAILYPLQDGANLLRGRIHAGEDFQLSFAFSDITSFCIFPGTSTPRLLAAGASLKMLGEY